MSHETWNLIKNSKRFYVRTFRWTENALVVSLFLNLLLVLAVYYSYFTLPEHDFYVTDGVNAPMMLTPMDAPNTTSVPLLANDPGTDDASRAIPQ